MLVCKSMFTYRFIQHTKVSISVSGSWFTMATNGSADLRSPEKEVYFRSWDFLISFKYTKVFVLKNFYLTHSKPLPIPANIHGQLNQISRELLRCNHRQVRFHRHLFLRLGC